MKKTSAPPALVRLCLQALEDKKAEDVRVLDVRAQSSLTDYLVVATGTSQPHLRALQGALHETIKASGARVVGVETREESGWTVMDAFDVMIHLFTPDQRERYGLENLWKDGAEVPPARLSVPAKKKKRRVPAAPRQKAAVKKRSPRSS